MIEKKENVYHLRTARCSYFVSISPIGKPICSHFGGPLSGDLSSLVFSPHLVPGRTVVYDQEHPEIALPCLPLEVSTRGKGDFSTPSVILEGEGLLPLDFVFKDSRIQTPEAIPGYPNPRNAEQELVLFLEDNANHLELELHYLTYRNENVIGRYSRIISHRAGKTYLRRLSSCCLSLLKQNLALHAYRGGWIDEFHEEICPVTSSTLLSSSATGSSGDLRNPFFYLSSSSGECFGFNLVYSGNHEEILEKNPMGFTRVLNGIDSSSFAYPLTKGQPFDSPLAVLGYGKDETEMTASFHSFVRRCVLPASHENAERPIVFNNWEGTYFDFNEAKLHALVKKAAKLGIELFVLDDGWFGKRNNDHCSLGDYEICKKKLPHLIKGLSDYVHRHGMKFGLWFEPEAISPDSDLYRAHPDWAIQIDGLKPSLGRNQLILDLTKPEVSDYVYRSLSSILSKDGVDFIKWDYNRNFSDVLPSEGRFAHDYILSLYALLKKLREQFPDLWMENCASGGSRNDLGMFSFFDTGWVSDNTDSLSRAFIQKGMIKGYPPCLMSNHVSAKTSHQTLRKTSFGTKFDVACFGVLGYEMDLNALSPLEEKEIAGEIAYYKKGRKTFQFGTYRLLEDFSCDGVLFQEMEGKDEIYVSFVRLLQQPNAGYRKFPAVHADENAEYAFSVRPETIDFHRFGGLVNQVSPIHLKEEGALVNLLSQYKGLDSEKFSGTVSGLALSSGALPFPQEWNGTGLHEALAVILDFGGRVYRFQKNVDTEEKKA